jgi:N-acetylglucosaminyl-diphospho-decaprenol L-rhamnosyltransferase
VSADVEVQIENRTVEVCVVSYKSERFHPSWFASAELANAGLAVADNHPSLSTARALHGLKSNVSYRIEDLPHNPGFGAACNRLAESSVAEWLVFLNPDAWITAFHPSALQSRHLVGAQQRTPLGREIHSSGQSYGVLDEIWVSWGRRRPPMPTGFGYVSGGAFAIERKVFLELGGFDEAFFLFYEDIDLCFRASVAGVRVVVDPYWDVTHHVGHATREHWHDALSTSYRPMTHTYA